MFALRSKQSMSTISASWTQRFAAQLIRLRPQTQPLQAVLDAMQAFDSTSSLSPEQAAELHPSVPHKQSELSSNPPVCS
jgi:hypothetical protein